MEEVKSNEKSKDSSNVSYERAEGEGELLLLDSDGPAGEHDDDRGLIMSHCREGDVRKLNNVRKRMLLSSSISTEYSMYLQGLLQPVSARSSALSMEISLSNCAA